MTAEPGSALLRHLRWDLDKTYLRTEFDSVRDLVRTFRQRAEDKRNVPGARPLLQELLLRSEGEPPRRLTFVSGSPRQMRRVLTEKLLLDGIEPDAFLLKPNLSNLLTLRFKAIRGQIGYKLHALLASRPAGLHAEETLFGDDAEQDALIYCLYAEVLAGRLDGDALRAVLRAGGAYGREREDIVRLAQAVEPGSHVRRIFIHLDRRSPTARFDAFGARVVPIFNYFQAALVLSQDGLLAPPSLMRVVESMAEEGYTPTLLANSLQDLVRRGFLAMDFVRALGAEASTQSAILGLAPSDFVEAFRRALAGILPSAAPPRPELPAAPVDYVALAAEQKYRRPLARLPRFRWLE
jgi:hypothetical protein